MATNEQASRLYDDLDRGRHANAATSAVVRAGEVNWPRVSYPAIMSLPLKEASELIDLMKRADERLVEVLVNNKTKQKLFATPN